MKTCKACLNTKPLQDFYKMDGNKDGFNGKCKECIKAGVRANRLANLAHYVAFDKARAMLPHRVEARAKYIKTDAGKASHNKSTAAYREKAPERRAAHVRIGNAVRDGRVVAWPVCAMPECSKKPEAHHPDYSRPLDVVWLCRSHHKQAHAITTTHPQ